MSINVRSQGNGYGNSSGPVGAPKASHVKDVLVALKDRLEIQLENEDDHDPALVRALRSNIRLQLEQINVALTRIEDGKYGVCTGCLTQINADRLVARPYSTLCIDCQGRQDRGKSAY
jgi:RNA polymerase-binding transcription factor DksA